MGLNPCSNGIQKYDFRKINTNKIKSLNPCSNGIQKYIMV